MYLNQFAVRVIGAKETSNGYVEIAHGTKFSLSMRNDRNTKANVYVVIQGKNCGVFRIEAHETIRLDRPYDADGRFTFYNVDSSEGGSIGGESGNPDNGLIQVTFIPELYRPNISYSRSIPYHPWPMRPTTGTFQPPTYTTSSTHNPVSYVSGSVSASVPEYNEGMVGLSGFSGQDFVPTGNIIEDTSQETVISLRLVGVNHSDTPRPLTQKGNPVPPTLR